ncbi:Bug family tripartite tricarboxylate transporter substrate binding protein [Sphaerotilus microaerophilus]|jgi:tripartite-type tricarboxylate transporter receptor subunit TctC|uniref:ABC transporter substrate-binding protein n=1 Tax=Sphaerotilus microaerophilus TaxID=2914710 RepID=A0ABN6PJA5_9BURK|nr:tripartite tricarboxylate transporter substrate binding protein [Sphaerotilus sp. FB-5]BDI03843.1 ABC transporter substrate-binding protein [Sphaerotilus sp. FB-5]
MTLPPPGGLSRRDALAGLAMLCLPGAVRAAEVTFPSRPVTLVVPFAPGGVADLTARTVGRALALALGQPVVVDNRPGAGGIVATQAVLKAPADGHTLLLISNATAVSVHLVKRLPYDVTRDLAPISTLGFFELALVVGSDSRWRSLGELVAHGRSHPGKLTLGTISLGSTQHLAAELFKARTGLDAVVVPYKGTPAVITALRAGEIDLGVEVLGPLLAQLQAGVIRALAVTGPKRFELLPGVPTALEQGVRDYTVDSWNALAAPAGTPSAVVERLRHTTQEALAQPGLRATLRDLGVKAQAGTPAELAALLASEIRHWGEVVRAARIEPA